MIDGAEALAGGAIALDDSQRAVLASEIDAIAAAASTAEARATFRALAEAVAAREVPADLAGLLGSVVEMSLASGRARQSYGAAGEAAMRALFAKTPRGTAAAASIDALNKALRELSGDTLETVSAATRGPGVYALTLATSRYRLVIRFDRAGAELESAEIDLD
ncbi:MAG TPA: hypothetical protein VNF45_01700 [Candidatus Binataceae bacterium]|nr:hypothetical protein [Candidatus Binataceae bacterium]